MSSVDDIFRGLTKFFKQFITTKCITILDEEIEITILYEEILFIINFFIDGFGTRKIIKCSAIKRIKHKTNVENKCIDIVNDAIIILYGLINKQTVHATETTIIQKLLNQVTFLGMSCSNEKYEPLIF